MKPTLTIFTYPGIGDFSWCYSKLVTLDRPLNIVYLGRPNAVRGSAERRLDQLLSILPQVQSFSIAKINRKHLRMPAPPASQLISGDSATFAMNAHLEAGNRIEDYAPEVGCDFHYDIDIPLRDKQNCATWLDGRENYLLLYASSFATTKAWSGWSPKQWANMAKLYRAEYGDDIPIVLTGARWDREMAKAITELIPDALNLVARTQLSTTLELINRSRYFISFPSGLPVMATVLKKPVYMLYPQMLSKMLWTWAPAEAIENRDYMASVFKSPAAVMADIALRSKQNV